MGRPAITRLGSACAPEPRSPSGTTRARRTTVPRGDTAMRRPPVALVSCLLTAATAIALVGTGLALTEPAPVTGRPETTGEQEAVARRFYAAADKILATGDPTALDAVVDPELVEHA